MQAKYNFWNFNDLPQLLLAQTFTLNLNSIVINLRTGGRNQYFNQISNEMLKYDVIIWLQPIWTADFISYFCALTSLMTGSRLCIHVFTAPPIMWKPLINQS